MTAGETISATTDSSVKALTTRWLLLRDEREALQEHIDVVAEQLVTALGIGGSCEIAPGIGVRVQQGPRVIDRAAVERFLTGEEFASICKLVVDPGLLRQRYPILADELLLPAAGPSLRRITS